MDPGYTSGLAVGSHSIPATKTKRSVIVSVLNTDCPSDDIIL